MVLLLVFMQLTRDLFAIAKFLYLFVYNAPPINVAGDLVALLQQEISWAFVSEFRCGLQLFSGKKSPFH